MICLLMIAASTTLPLISYIGGRQGWPLCVGALPAQLIPVIIQLLCLVALVSLFVKAVSRKTAIIPIMVGLTVGLVFMIGGCSVKNETPFIAGFKECIRENISLAELRTVARVARSQIPVDGYLPSPSKWSLWTEKDHRQSWTVLMNSTVIGKLPRGVVVRVGKQDVELIWGGALPGHWGIVIRDVLRSETLTNREGNDWSQRQYDVVARKRANGEAAADIAPDIGTFYRE